MDTTSSIFGSHCCSVAKPTLSETKIHSMVRGRLGDSSPLRLYEKGWLLRLAIEVTLFKSHPMY
jgi:hypothetical protein